MPTLQCGEFRIWFGTDDAPAPSGSIPHGDPAAVRVGVLPDDPNLTIRIRYRQGDTWLTLPAQALPREGEDAPRYFEAAFPSLAPGTTVEYTVECRRAGEVIQAGDSATLMFQVVTLSSERSSGLEPMTSDPTAATPETVDRPLREEEGDVPISTNASAATGSPTTRNLISGRVAGADGRPWPGLVVRIFEPRVGESPGLLARATTDEEGRWNASGAMLSSRAHLRIAAYAAGAADDAEPLASTLVRATAARDEIHLRIGGSSAPTVHEVDRLHAALGSRVAKLEPTQAPTTDDVALLAADTGASEVEVTRYLRARRLVAESATVGRGLSLATAHALVLVTGATRRDEVLVRRRPAEIRAEVERLVERKMAAPQALEGLDAAVDGLRREWIDTLLAATDGFGGLLDAAGVDPADRRLVAGLRVDHGRGEAFDTAVAENPELNASARSAFQLTFELGRLTSGHVPLVRALLAEPRFTEARELARLDETGWAEQLARAGESDRKRTAELSRTLARRAEMAYPTTAIAAAMTRAGERPRVSRFLDAHPAFELGREHIPSFLAAADVIVDEAERDTLQPELLELQRVYRLSPPGERYPVMRALLHQGFDSAYAIRRSSRESFVARIAPLVPDPDGEPTAIHAKIGAAYDRAVAQSQRAEVAFALGMDQALVPGNILGLDSWFQKLPDSEGYPDDPQLGPRIAEYRELFGAVDFCACRDCDSVLSPSAYFVDLLRWLGELGLLGALTKDRRPDLVHLPLSQANADTLVPHIDLVNEILEQATTGATPVVRSTPEGLTADELRAVPAHTDAAAYDRLRDRTNPRGPGLDLWAARARAFLARLGLTRAEIMEAFRPVAEHDLAAETLGLTPGERSLLLGGSGTFDWTGHGHYVVRRFLRATRLDLQQLLDLLHTQTANPGAKLKLKHQAPDHKPAAPCDLDQLRIQQGSGQNPSTADYLRLHRFLVLWRRTPWSMLELDKVVQTLSAGKLTAALLLDLAALLRLSRKSGADVLTLLSLWSQDDHGLPRMDTRDDRADSPAPQRSLYRRVFLDPTRVRPSDAFAAAAAPPPPPDPAAPTPDAPLLAEHRSALQAALGLSAGELQSLERETLGGTSVPPELSLENLSMLHRETAAAAALGAPILESRAWRRLSPIDPLDSPRKALALATVVGELRASGFTADRLLYLFATDAEAAASLGVDEKATAQLLWQARRALQAVGPERRPLELEKTLADLLGMDVRIVRSVLDQPVAPSMDSARDVLLAPSFVLGLKVPDRPLIPGIDPDMNVIRHPEPFRAIVRLQKLVLLYTPLRVNFDLHQWLATHAAAWSLLDPLSLPVDPDLAAAYGRMDGAPTPGKQLEPFWQPFVDLIALLGSLARLPGQLPDLVELLRLIHDFNADADPARLDNLARAVERRTSCRADDVAYVCSLVIGASPPNVPLDVRGVVQLERCLRLATRLGASAQAMHGWSAGNLDQAAASALMDTVAAHFDHARWLELARDTHDPLRVAQRDVLMADIFADDRFKDTADLHGHLLIDPEVSACALTSRLSSAILSVQLYVQRILLGLESGRLSDNDRHIWRTWRRTYRLWEANRQVFIYPENWLRPELRRDKSELFDALEKELREDELTSRPAERAAHKYVRSLAEIARLDLSAMYTWGNNEYLPDNPAGTWEPTFSMNTELYMFGRTHQQPFRHFYRRWIPHINAWSPWSEIKISIPSSHIIPAVKKSWVEEIFLYDKIYATHPPPPDRLVLLWPRFEEQREQVSEKHPPLVWREIQLEWTALIDNVWTTPTSTRTILTIPPDGKDGIGTHAGTLLLFQRASLANERAFYFDASHDVGGDLSIACGVQLRPSDLDIPTTDSQILPLHLAVGLGRFSIFDGTNAVAEQNGPPRVDPDHLLPVNGVAQASYRWHHEFEPPGVLSIALLGPDSYLRDGRLDGRVSWQVISSFDSSTSQQFGIAPGSVPTASVVRTHGLRNAFHAIQDHRSAYLVTLSKVSADPVVGALMLPSEEPSEDEPLLIDFAEFSATPLYHRFASEFLDLANSQGIKTLLGAGWDSHKPSSAQMNRQQRSLPPYLSGGNGYDLQLQQSRIAHLAPVWDEDTIAFDSRHAYACYNWELFLHIPILVAERLRAARRFEEAKDWYHHIFDPLNQDVWSVDDPNGRFPRDVDGNPVGIDRRYWLFRPFLAPPGSPIQNLLREAASLSGEIAAWTLNPYEPDIVAQLRPTAYQKAVVMAYLDNLIEWGDDLFRRNTREYINEAAQLYLLAAKILGDPPAELAGRERPARTYQELAAEGLDAFANVLVPLENLLDTDDAAAGTVGSASASSAGEPSLYFCVPPNPKLLDYWDRVADRLFKIRHCMDLEGRVRDLPLWPPPIDPEILVRATAAGVDIETVLRDRNAPLPQHRFAVLHQKAISVAASVRALGGALTAALEKRDAEELAVLRSDLEIELQESVLETRRKQIEEVRDAKAAIEA